jgi:hypothetical protein
MSDEIARAIAKFDTVIDAIGSCGDGYCYVKRPKGMHTNGGCRCSTDRFKAQRVMMAAQTLRAALSPLLPEQETSDG